MKKNRTHCSKGHELDGDNVYMDGFSRKCRTCARDKQAEYRLKKQVKSKDENMIPDTKLTK